jgi:hypothetical protein
MQALCDIVPLKEGNNQLSPFLLGWGWVEVGQILYM